MAESAVAISAGSGTNIGVFVDPAGFDRQIVVVGDATAAATQAIDASGRASVTATPSTATGNITTQNLVPGGAATAGSAVEVTLGAAATLSIQTTGTYTGVLSVQVTIDGATWVTMAGTPMLNINTGAYSATIASAAVSVYQVDVAGFLKARVTALAAVTGTAVVTVIASQGTGLVALDASIPAGTAVIGALSANQSVNNAQVSGTATSVNNGTVDAGTTRVTVASDSTGGLLARRDLVRVAVNSGGLTTSVTAYTAGDQVGTQFTIAGVARASGGTGTIVGVTLTDANDIIGAYDVIFTRASITLATDNAAYAISDADALNVIGISQLAGAFDIGNNRVAQAFNLAIPYDCSGGTSLFAGLICRVGHTFFTAATDLQLTVWVERN